jgi:AraC-like DNA-binding protein
MRIVRPDQSWCVLLPSANGQLCLQSLALRCGYRVGEICEELGCGRRYFYEVFLRDIGMPPKEWMRWERMVVARRMLTGGKTPEEIAEMLGFCSKHNFRREFLQTHQIHPLDFQSRQCAGVDRFGDWERSLDLPQ